MIVPRSGILYWLHCVIICDTCGTRIAIDDIPAVFIGEYEVQRGRYDSFEFAFWVICKGCGASIEEVKFYRSLNMEVLK